jgi:hypothetical protein
VGVTGTGDSPITGIERRQRWAAFSVKAHTDPKSLAVDLLLYDRLILPVPADEDEYGRWTRRGWDPDNIALRQVQAPNAVLTVPWTDRLREQWGRKLDERRAQLGQLGLEVGFALTGMIYAASPDAWIEIHQSLTSEGGPRPTRKPWLVAAYQSEDEANAELGLAPFHVARPGERPVDQQVKLKARHSVYEPDIPDPEDAWLAATDLVLNPRFLRAREALFNVEDRLHTDGWDPDEIESALDGAVEEYRDAVRALHKQTRRRTVTSVFASVGGWAVTVAGHPHLKFATSKGIQLVSARFWPLGESIHPENMPGAALDMISASFRRAEAEADKSPN